MGNTWQCCFLERQEKDRVSTLWILTAFPLARKEKWNKKMLGTFGQRSLLKAKEGLGTWDAGVNCKTAGWGPLWPPWPETVRSGWARQLACRETCRCFRRRIPRLGDDYPGAREDSGSWPRGLVDGEATFSERRQKGWQGWVCRRRWGLSPACWAWDVCASSGLGSWEDTGSLSPALRDLTFRRLDLDVIST